MNLRGNMTCEVTKLAYSPRLRRPRLQYTAIQFFYKVSYCFEVCRLFRSDRIVVGLLPLAKAVGA